MFIKMKSSIAVLLATSLYTVPTFAVDADFYSLEKNSDNARSLTNPIIPVEMLIKDNGNVRVKFEFDQSNSLADKESCVVLDYVQILTNRDIPTSYDVNGNPIVSKWETVFERGSIRNSKGGDQIEPLDINLLRSYCLQQSISTSTNYNDLYNARGQKDAWKFQIKPGDWTVSNRVFNESIDRQDAELRVGITYLPKRFPYEASVYTSTHVGTLEEIIERDDEWQIAFKAEMTMSLHDTIPVIEEIYDHKLKELSAVSGYNLPVAYVKQTDGSSGCYGTMTPGNEAWLGGFLMFESPYTIDCLFASENTTMNDVAITNRTMNDILVMCPGSTIQPHVDYSSLISQGAGVPTASNLPYPRIMASGNPAWCQNLEKIERSWTDLASIAEEGWMVGINQQTGNLECIASNGACANSLVDGINLRDIDTPQEALSLETLVLTGSSQDCRYQNNSVFACPSDLYISEPSLIDLLNAFQLSAFQDLNTVSFNKGNLLLRAGDNITTINRRLQMQHDGNLVLYRFINGQYDGALWASHTNSGSDYQASFQGDGNFVIYGNGVPKWSTNTHASPSGSTLKLQGDGDLVIYSSSGQVLWSTGTAE